MRRNGSIRGPLNEPTTLVATGVWTLNDVYEHVRASRWPVASGGGAQAPDMFGNLTLWVDATDVTTLYDASGGSQLTTDAQTAGMVLSKGSINRGLFQGSSTAEPAYRTGIVNGNSVLRFDNSDDNFFVTDRSGTTAGSNVSAATLLGAGDYTYILALSILSASQTSGSTYANHRVLGDSGGYLGLYVKNIDGGTCYLQGYSYDSGGDKHADIAVNKGEFLVVTVKHDGSNVKIRVNGGAWTSVASGDAASASSAMAVSYPGTPYNCNMDLVQLAMYSAAMADADILSVEQYMGASIGVTI